MADTDITATTTTTLDTSVTDFKVSGKTLDTSQINETKWYNSNWYKYLGYYKQIPELKKSIDALAMWTAGRGWISDIRTTILLEHIQGWGEDTFHSIIKNMIIVKKVNGDSYAEIIRDNEGTLINLKPLNPNNIVHVVNDKGLIVRYEEINLGINIRKIPVEKILHFCNDRIANEIHGTSVVEACQWVIDARNEAMNDKRRVHHRSTIRVIEVDMDDTSKINNLKTDYAEAIKKGEVLLVPKGNVAFPNAPINYIDTLQWIQYLENFFYQAVGIPKIILGGSQDFTEASSKIGYLTFEQPYMTEQREIEEDLWNQLGIQIKFNRPISLKEAVQESEAANTGQIGFQPTEMIAGRNE